ncbi:MAG: PIN domain-containing protein, partial [Segetibacter sp.]|nr:PIN domain-containing protein [Segetibacter sp.]
MAYKIFVDANVYLDFFQQRGDDWKEAEAIFELAEKNSIEVITSSSIVLNLMYVMKRYDTPQLEIIKYANAILKCSTLKDPDNRTFMTALSSGFADLEDAVQYHTALHVKGMDYFITSNVKDFKKATSQLSV